MVRRSARTRTDQMNLFGVKPAEDSGSGRVWLITFTDLVSLMLTFFVMLFAMSNVKLDEWNNISDSLSRTLKPTPEQQIKKVTATFNIGTIYRKQATDIDYLSSVLEDNISDIDGLAGAQITLHEDRLVVSLRGDLLFEPGRAVLTAAARDSLFILGGIFKNIDNQIGVNGHTDPNPPSGNAYASNWELSTGRAAAVANALRRVGYQDQIVALGYSDTKYSELPEIAESERQALGPRIEIVILPTVRTN